MLYYFTASDKNAQKHLKDTIESPYYLEPYLHLLEKEDPGIVNKLKVHHKDKYVHMWGATPGSGNIGRWGRLKNGDKVLVYSQGTFLYYGTILEKTHNKTVAENVWGKDNKNQTWEYIYFIKDLKSISIEKKKFAAFFNYKLNFNPQGFNNINKEKLQATLSRYANIDEMIKSLNQNFIISTDENEEDNFQASTDSDFSKVDTTQIKEEPVNRKRPKTVNSQTIWDRDSKIAKMAIKKAGFKCEIDSSHDTFISDSSDNPYMEAHHLIPMKVQHEFKNSLDVVGNVVCICPNCHRKIHLAKPKEKKALLIKLFLEREATLSKYALNIELHHLLSFYGIS